MTRSSFFSLAGQVVEVRTNRDGLLADIDGTLSGLRMDNSADADFLIEIYDVDAPTEDFPGTVVFDGDVPEDGRCRMI